MKENIIYPIIGLDISKNRIGFAVLDSENVIPRPMFTFERTKRTRDIEETVLYLHKFDAKTVVVGLPLELNGAFGDKAVWVRRIAKDIMMQSCLPVFLVDERYTTVIAKEYAESDRGVRESDIDALAAANILTRFIEIKNDEEIIAV